MKRRRPGWAVAGILGAAALVAVVILAFGPRPPASDAGRSGAPAVSPTSVGAATPVPIAGATTTAPAVGAATPVVPTPGSVDGGPSPSIATAPTPGTSADAAAPTVAQLVGQKLVITIAGRTPSAGVLGRIRRGEIGGVVLLGSNIATRAQLKALTAKLQAAATAGGQPPLLIAVDQEGGSVKRVPWAPPRLTIPGMGRIGSVAVARSQGAKTGAALHALGINVDLAPVADIPRSTASFMYQQGRTFSFDALRTAALADAFAAGLASKGTLATMKHFPGIGRALRNTDHYVDTIRASKAGLAADLRPYRGAIAAGLPLIMLSNATYTAYDPANAAGWSHAIAVSLLRDDLGFEGVTITDSLSGTAHARGVTVKPLAIRAAIAGTDMIMVTGSEASSKGVYRALLAAAKDGTIPLATLRASYDRILALKARF